MINLVGTGLAYKTFKNFGGYLENLEKIAKNEMKKR